MMQASARSAVEDGKARPQQAAEGTPRRTGAIDVDVLQKAILNSAEFTIIATDANGIITLFNRGAERMLGYSADEVLDQKTPADFHDPRQEIARAEALSAEFGTAVTPGLDAMTFKASRGIEDTYALDAIRKDGSRFPIHVTATALRDEQNEIVGYLRIGIDNSAQAAMIAAEKEKERLKDEFIATVSHELRTPLTSIVGALGLLKGNAAGIAADSARRLLTIAYTNSQRLARLLNDILDVEKMESGNAVFDLKRVEVRSLLELTIEENRTLAESRGVRIRLESAPAPGDVRGDPDRLVQAVTNLLSNAIKFSPAGEEVVVAVEAKDDNVRISVRDHGPGVPAEFKPRIFEKFAQADNTDARRKGGTGLGLSIVKQIVERLDGKVGFDDAPGGGAVFHIDLPDWAHAVRLQNRFIRKARLRVLLCEDNPDAEVALLDRLNKEGFVTDIARTASEAVARVAATSYAAILVDLQLPEGDGISLIKRLRAQPQAFNTLLVALSAEHDAAAAGERPSTVLDILDWLDAPIDVARLVRVLDRPIVRESAERPRVLHVESDPELLRAVAEVLGAKAEVMSVNSVAEARRALAANRFDVAVFDVAMAAGSGVELLHELRDSEGEAIPLVMFSSQGTDSVLAAQVRNALAKSRTSIDSIVATLQKRLAASGLPPSEKDAG